MGLLKPFDRTPRPVPAALASSESVRTDALLPVLRSWWSFAGEALTDRIFGTEAPCAPAVSHIGSDLGVALIAAAAGAASAITGAQLQASGLAPEAALSAALDNLRPRSAPAFESLKPGLFLSQWRDGYDASRLLFPDLVAALPVKGDPVVLAPTRNALLVAGADDTNALLALADAGAETLSTTDQPLSARPLRLRDGKWTDFALDSEELGPFYDLLRGQWTREYAEQKQLLDQLHAQNGDDIVVGDYAPMQNRHTGKPFCMTFWVDGFVNLLPRADAVVLKSAAEVMVVPWRTATAVIAHRLASTDHYPIRYRAEAFPSADELGQLRAVATLAKPAKPA
jgi:uncharacterized protein YtpQ (UPF0354 family)